MRWGRKRQSEAEGGVRGAGASAESVARQLEERGVPRELSAPLADGLAARIADLGGEAMPALIEGALLALELQGSAGEGLRRSLRDLREVERLMGAFSGELSKLDEVLEVLAAYVRRMRTSTPTDEVRTLH